MFNIRNKIIIFAAALATTACASTQAQQQTLVVNTPEPGAQVYLSLTGDTAQAVRVPGIVRGSLPTGDAQSDFAYLGTTPLTYTFATAGYEGMVRVPGQFRTYSTTHWHEGMMRVEHANGTVEHRRFNVRNGSLEMNFPGAARSAEPEALSKTVEAAR